MNETTSGGHPRGRSSRSRGPARSGPPANRRVRKGPPSPPAAPGSGSRRLAYNVLHEVGASGAFANLALARFLGEASLTDRDAAFATTLVNGVLRNRTLLDEIASDCVHRDLDRLDPRLVDVLRMGTYQWVFLETAAHAAVSTSVDLAIDVVGSRPSGLVNAALRRVVSREPDSWLKSVTDLSTRWSHPAWIVAALSDALGSARRDELPALLAADNREPPVTLVARPGLSEVAELLADGAVRGRWSALAARMEKGSPGGVSAVSEGRAGVQDEGSQLVTLAFAMEQISGPDRVWVDACAGPGGKAALLAAIGSQRGARLVAIDRRDHRTELVRHSLGRMADSAWAVVADSRAMPVDQADRVIVDAPCSGLGVLRRRPDLRWRRTPGDVGELSRLQSQLVDAAIDAVRPGGLLAYVTCSPHVAETDLVIDPLRRDSRVEMIDGRPHFLEIPDLGPGPAVRLWPHLHDTDGMYLALMRRRA